MPSDRKKCDVNSEPQLQVTCMGTLCLLKTWITKSLASSGAVMSSMVGMKIPCLESRSTTMRSAVWPEESGRCSMKSMEMEFQGRSGTSKVRKVYDTGIWIFCKWCKSSRTPGQKYED